MSNTPVDVVDVNFNLFVKIIDCAIASIQRFDLEFLFCDYPGPDLIEGNLWAQDIL